MGVIEGGWEFVAAAYIVSAVVVTAYAVSVFRRYRTDRDDAAAEARRETGS